MFKRLRKSLMMLGECFSMSLSNILNNRVRSFLTVLGILIGVTAVIALITTVSGFSGTLSSSFMSMGAGTLSVSVTGSDLKSGLSASDLAELTDMEIVEGITPNVTLRSRLSKGGKYKTNVSVSGKNYFYFVKTDGALERGRPIHPTDESSSTFVCLINHTIMEELFYGVDPVGETMYVDGVPFLVIGGLLGVTLGLGLSFALCRVMGMTFVISPSAILLGVSFSAAVGIVFGWAPARKASRLNPIDALRAM